jgi:DNA ligase (NAD+)
MSKDRIKELEEKINQARKDYYNGASKVSDRIYDAWIDELSSLDPKNLAVIGIGSEPVSMWEKYLHKVPMGSLNKVQTEDEYKKWHDKYIEPNDEIFLTLKLDGLSVSLIYENGVLNKAITRGSGTQGEIITPNVAKMIGVPLRLSQKVDATIRGEILLSKENYEKHFKEYSNERNAASGISRRYDGEKSEFLSVLTYELICDDFDLKTQKEQFETLKSLGFLVPDYKVLHLYNEVIDLKNKYQSSLRDQFSYLLDGLVIHNNNLSKQMSFGSLNNKPYSTVAYKFDSIAKEANLVNIVNYVGNSGRITPVAIFYPKVDLVGAEVEKASLHNYANINELGIDMGCKVLLCRSNDVIPYVEEVTESTGTIYKAPTNCPSCNSILHQNGEYLQCPNTNGCPSQVAGRIKNWIKDLNILEWGDTLIEKLVDTGKAKNVADLYSLTIDDLASIDRMGQKSAKKCYDNLWAMKEVSLDVFLGALSIPLIGSSTIRLIMKNGCDTLEKFGQLTASQFEMVPGIGPTRAQSLSKGLKDNQQMILNILSKIDIKKPKIGTLSNKSVCFTGTLSMKRADLEKLVIDNGGTLDKSCTKNTSFLVMADANSTSSKAVSARKNGTACIDEDEFLKLLK